MLFLLSSSRSVLATSATSATSAVISRACWSFRSSLEPQFYYCFSTWNAYVSSRRNIGVVSGGDLTCVANVAFQLSTRNYSRSASQWHQHTSEVLTATNNISTTKNSKPSSDKDQPISKSSGDNLVLKYFQQRDAKFLYSATKAEHYRHLSEPEITFAGRSNVGKSSLIGAVLRSAGLVKTSKKPGHTSLLNFFSLTSSAHPAAISVVDMPGYGFRSRDEWGQFIIEYLSTRKVLRRVFLLIESKVGELKSTDCSFLELAEKHGVPVQLVLTKTDKLKRTSLDKISNAVVREAKEIGPTVVQPYVIHCSAKTKDGITAVQEEILRVCNVTLGQGAS